MVSVPAYYIQQTLLDASLWSDEAFVVAFWTSLGVAAALWLLAVMVCFLYFVRFRGA